MNSPFRHLLALALGLPLGFSVAFADSPIYPPYHGPKKTIAVAGFDANGAFAAAYGTWDVGAGLSAMLATELTRTHRFIVVERARLVAALREQQLGGNRLAGTRPAGVGQLLGAQLLIQGTVTDFSQTAGGGGLRLALGGSKLSSGLGRRTRRGHVAIDLRLVDATTGRIVDALTVDREVKTKSVALDLRSGDVKLGGDRFRRTALGKAARAAIGEAVGRIVSALEDVPWQGMVAQVEGRRVYINAGRDANLAPGATLRCKQVATRITDPATGELLGGEERTIGEIRVQAVQDRFAVGEFVGAVAPRRGDLVHLIEN